MVGPFLCRSRTVLRTWMAVSKSKLIIEHVILTTKLQVDMMQARAEKRRVQWQPPQKWMLWLESCWTWITSNFAINAKNRIVWGNEWVPAWRKKYGSTVFIPSYPRYLPISYVISSSNRIDTSMITSSCLVTKSVSRTVRHCAIASERTDQRWWCQH